MVLYELYLILLSRNHYPTLMHTSEDFRHCRHQDQKMVLGIVDRDLRVFFEGFLRQSCIEIFCFLLG